MIIVISKMKVSVLLRVMKIIFKVFSCFFLVLVFFVMMGDGVGFEGG